MEGPEKPLSREQRKRLRLGDDEPVKYRRVALACGDHILSEADNWYVPARLTPEMNRLLETTDTPFGRVVQSLQPTREEFLVDPAVASARTGLGNGGPQARPSR